MTAEIESAFLSAVRSMDDYHWALRSGIEDEHFASYLPVWRYVADFAAQYGSIPQPETLEGHFADLRLLPNPESLKYEFERLTDAYIKRAASQAMIDASKTINADPLGSISTAMDSLSKIRTKAVGSIGYLDSDAEQRYASFMEKFAYSREHPDEVFSGIKTGIEIIDLIGFGWMAGSMNAIIGMTGTGKSEIVIRSIVEAWMNGHRILVVSPEMTRAMIGYRLDVIVARLMGWDGMPTNMELMSGRTTERAAERYAQFIGSIRQRDDIMCIDQRSATKAPTVSEVRSMAGQHGARLVIVDGFKLLTDAGNVRNASAYDHHVNIFSDLAAATQQEGFATVVVEHVTRDVKVNQLPTLQQSNMGQHVVNGCERILALGMAAGQPNKRIIASLKQRYGPPVVQRKLISYDVNTGDVGRWVDTPAMKKASDLAQFLKGTDLTERDDRAEFGG